MKFKALYEYAGSLVGPAISVRELAKYVAAHHPSVGEVNFYSVELDPRVSKGHMVYERERSSAYEEEFKVANIRYHQELNRCERRFVCCKELMHVFDSDDERVDNQDKFVTLLKQLETRPLHADKSPMLHSEDKAYWMAILALCPENQRNVFVSDWKKGILTDYDVALKIKVPEMYINAIMSDYYERARFSLIV